MTNRNLKRSKMASSLLLVSFHGARHVIQETFYPVQVNMLGILFSQISYMYLINLFLILRKGFKAFTSKDNR